MKYIEKERRNMKEIRRNVFINSKLKRLSLSFVLALCLLAGCFYAGAQKSQGKLQQEIQKIKDRGEPTTIEELIPREIPDKENGALVYRKAFKLKKDLEKKYKEEWKYMPYEGAKEWEEISEEEKGKITALLFKNSEFLRFYQLLEKASNMKCRFSKRKDYQKSTGISGKSGHFIGMLLPQLAGMRSCARMLAAKAKIQSEIGQIDDALNTSLTSLKVAKSLSNEPILISQLVRIALDSLAIDNIRKTLEKGVPLSIEIYQNLIREIEKERKDKMIYSSLIEDRILGRQNYAQRRKRGETFFEFTEEDRKKIEKAYFHLKDHKKFKEEMEKKMEANIRKYKKRIKDAYLKSGCKSADEFLNQQEFFYLKTMANAISLTKQPYWKVRDELKKLNEEIKNAPVSFDEPIFYKIYTQEARIDARLGAVEIVLALKIYKDRKGHYPSSLVKLTPRIINKLPKDPFTGKNYVYRREGDGFIVYSLGDNAKDDGGISGLEKRWQGDFDIVWREVNAKSKTLQGKIGETTISKKKFPEEVKDTKRAIVAKEAWESQEKERRDIF